MNRKLIGIVPAAGTGSRAGGQVPKQYQRLGRQPILRRAVSALLAEPRIAQVRVAVAAGDTRADTALAGLPRTVWRPCGGPSRAETVLAALDDARREGAAADSDWVLIHDAARPGLPADALARLIDTCVQAGQGGLLALPMADTVKRQSCDADAGPEAGPAVVAESVAREHLWLAQTPQMFQLGVLRQALADSLAAGHSVTDESSAIEYTGGTPLLVPGSMRNFKVTWPGDFDLMARWLD